MFAISTTLNLTGLLLLLKRTPPNQVAIRKYLIFIQGLLIVIDTHLEIGFHPVPLFPALAGYATGLFIQMGFPVHLELLITIILYLWMGMSILFCILFRHQTLFSEGSPFKLKQRTITIIQSALIVGPTALSMIYLFRFKDAATVERLLLEDVHNLTWVRDRGPYYVEKRTPLLMFALIVGQCIMVFGTLGVILIFIHMFYFLRQDKAKRSAQSFRTIRRSLIALFCQLICPLSLFACPMLAILIGLAIPDLLTFEAMISCFFMLPWHSVGHNLMLLTITSAYRNALVSCASNAISSRATSFSRKETRVRQSSTVR